MTRFNPQRSIECLEQKQMMAADLGSGLLGAIGDGSATVQAAAAAAGQNVAATTHLTAELSGTGQGSLNLANANLVLHVSGAPAGQTFDVSIDGNVIGSISTNVLGNGILHLNSALNNADALLDLLPTIAADAHVSVGIRGETPILTGTLEATADVGVDFHGVTGALTGALQTASSFENALLTKVNSLVDNLDSHTESLIDSLLATVDNVENVADRLVGRVESLSAATVDKLFDHADVSGLLDDIRGLVPIDVRRLL